jgi:hypothetical protein
LTGQHAGSAAWPQPAGGTCVTGAALIHERLGAADADAVVTHPLAHHVPAPGLPPVRLQVRSEQESKTRKGGGESDGEDAPVLAKRVQLPAQAEQVGRSSSSSVLFWPGLLLGSLLRQCSAAARPLLSRCSAAALTCSCASPAPAHPAASSLAGLQVAATFQTPLGRSVHAFFFDPRQSGPALSVADLFLPRWVGAIRLPG